jgi:hypothetical protein
LIINNLHNKSFTNGRAASLIRTIVELRISPDSTNILPQPEQDSSKNIAEILVAMRKAQESLSVPILLDASDVLSSSPDSLLIILYLSQFYKEVRIEMKIILSSIKQLI